MSRLASPETQPPVTLHGNDVATLPPDELGKAAGLIFLAKRSETGRRVHGINEDGLPPAYTDDTVGAGRAADLLINHTVGVRHRDNILRFRTDYRILLNAVTRSLKSQMTTYEEGGHWWWDYRQRAHHDADVSDAFDEGFATVTGRLEEFRHGRTAVRKGHGSDADRLHALGSQPVDLPFLLGPDPGVMSAVLLDRDPESETRARLMTLEKGIVFETDIHPRETKRPILPRALPMDREIANRGGMPAELGIAGEDGATTATMRHEEPVDYVLAHVSGLPSDPQGLRFHEYLGSMGHATHAELIQLGLRGHPLR